MRVAYADPPYLGTSKFNAEHHYGHLHSAAADYDDIEVHRDLIGRLVAEFPDGWALSLGSNTLRLILPLCPEDVRVGAWVKGWCSWKPGVHPKYAWEPVIFRGGRTPEDAHAVRDWVMCNIATNQPVKGAKPQQFCAWVFALLGLNGDDDELVDLFPGSGAVTRAWEKWRTQLDFGASETHEAMAFALAETEAEAANDGTAAARAAVIHAAAGLGLVPETCHILADAAIAAAEDAAAVGMPTETETP